MKLLCLLLCACWFNIEFKRFPLWINRQVYDDLQALHPFDKSFSQFMTESSLQPKALAFPSLFWLINLGLFVLFANSSWTLLLIATLLTYLAVLDYYYYLTDWRYIGLIFLLGIYRLSTLTDADIQEGLLNLLCTAGFFLSFNLITQHLWKKEMLGQGDILLFLALAPLFSLEQMLLCILHASLLGLAWALFLFCKYQRKTSRLPFIPFIALSTLLHFLATLGQT